MRLHTKGTKWYSVRRPYFGIRAGDTLTTAHAAEALIFTTFMEPMANLLVDICSIKSPTYQTRPAPKYRIAATIEILLEIGAPLNSKFTIQHVWVGSSS